MLMVKAQAERPDALIEAEIGKLFNEAPNNPERARHLLALRFYLNDVIGIGSALPTNADVAQLRRHQ
jgi:hypothetical protein